MAEGEFLKELRRRRRKMYSKRELIKLGCSLREKARYGRKENASTGRGGTHSS